ncbi:MAG TPA: cytochrome c biogenesis protein ResB, partial [Methylomirabilota bacterium]|nr:cytochrome c biogenesis protein ResB [Methylomirabilota bacterium]
VETAGAGEPTAAIATQGETVDLGGVRVEFVREGRFALLQIARNPGIPIFIAASLLLVGGLAITFYFPHRRVRGIVAAAENGSVAHLAPLAKRDWSGQRDFTRLLEEVASRLHLAPEVTTPAHRGPDGTTASSEKRGGRPQPEPTPAD